MTRRRLLVFGAGLLAALGLWQLGGAGAIHAKAALAQVLLERSWTRSLEGAAQPRPWPWADTYPVARLAVPELGIDEIVLAGANGRSLTFGPAHLAGTAAPGEAGHAILTGHRDTHFTFLRDLRPGQEIRVQRPDGGWRGYRVVETAVIDARHARLAQRDDGTSLTLVTCYPFDAVEPGGPLRYLIYAEAATR
ncbi:MAG: class GN sortase [Rhodovibrionaceae bacterium]